MNDPSQKKNDRRQFLIRGAKAGALIALGGGAGYLFYDGQGPQAQEPEPQVAIPDFSVPPLPGKQLAVVKTGDRVQGMRRAIALLGGIQRFVEPGETVLIKPNAAFASSPQLGATSHPDLVADLVELCFKAGARRVIVADNPINAPQSCFMLSGIEKAALSAGAEVMLPRADYFKNASLPSGRLIRDWPVFFKPLQQAHKLIGLAPVKSHHRSGASLAMKNWYGFLGGRRNIFHQDIHTIICELALLFKPTLVILDAVTVMMTNGPTGGSLDDLQRKNTIVAGCDQVAADAFACTLLGLTAKDLPHIAMAEKAGAGTSDYAALDPLISETA